MVAQQFLCSVSLYSGWLRCGANWVAKEEIMKALPKILLALTGVAALSLAYPASLQAVPTTYQYIGNHFTDVSGIYTTSDFVTAMVTLASPLPPNFQGEVTPRAFTLFDGVQTITQINGIPIEFVFSTDASGFITNWHVDVLTIFGSFGVIDTVNSTAGSISDAGVFGLSNGFNMHRPGEWTVRPVVSDTGSTLSLLTLTLMALGLVTRRFQRAAG
jgi:hypothetical protein